MLGIVLRLAPEGEPLDTVRFVFQCVGLAAMITSSVAYFVAIARGKVFFPAQPRMRKLGRRERRRIGWAAIGRASTPPGAEDIVRISAQQVVARTPLQVMVFVGSLLLETSVVSQATGGWDATRWIVVAGTVLVAVALVASLRQYHGALRVLARSEPAPADEVR